MSLGLWPLASSLVGNIIRIEYHDNPGLRYGNAEVVLDYIEDYLKMNNKSKTKKCNAIVGSTLATSYFHGDIACFAPVPISTPTISYEIS